MDKGKFSGRPIVSRRITALYEKHAGNQRAQDLLEFAGLLERAKAIYQLLGGHPIGEMTRDTFSALGAFTMQRLGYRIEEFEPLAKAFRAALLADATETAESHKEEASADKIEQALREGDGADEAAQALRNLSRKDLN